MGTKEPAQMTPKQLREALDAAVGLCIVAYLLYAKLTHDEDLTKLKAHARYHWWKVKLWWKKSQEPAWKKELRAYFTVTTDPVPEVSNEA